MQISPSCDDNFNNVYATSCFKADIKEHQLAFGLAFVCRNDPKHAQDISK